MYKLLTLTILIALLQSGCSVYKITSQDLTKEYYPPKNSISEVAFLEKVDRPHDVIGIVTVNTERRQSFDEILKKIKREAAILGADAVTNIQSDATGKWKQLPAQKFIGNGYIRANYSANIVAYR